MKLRKFFILIITIFIIFQFLYSLQSYVYAENGFSAAGLTTRTDSTKFDQSSHIKSSNATNVAEKSSKVVVTIIRIVGITIAIVMLLIVAIKYMVSSAGDRADIKKHAIVYVVGAVILFGAVGILGTLNNLTTEALKKG
jgi:hypothetical protein